MGCHIAIAVKSTCFCWAATGHHVCTWVSSHAKFQGLSGMIALVIRISGWFRSTKCPLISRNHVWGCHPSVALFNNPPVMRLDLRRAPPTTRNQMKPFSGGISESMNLCSLGDVASQLVPKLWPQENAPNLWVYVPTLKGAPRNGWWQETKNKSAERSKKSPVPFLTHAGARGGFHSLRQTNRMSCRSSPNKMFSSPNSNIFLDSILQQKPT